MGRRDGGKGSIDLQIGGGIILSTEQLGRFKEADGGRNLGYR